MGDLRVLLIGPYPQEDGRVVGGVEAVTSSLAHALADREDIQQVAVLSFLHRGGIPCHRRISEKLDVRHLRGQDRLSLPTGALLEVMRGRRVTAQVRPDIIHGQGIGAPGHIATSISDRAVVTAHGLVQKEVRLATRGNPLGGVRVTLVDRMVSNTLRRAAVVISTSQYDARALASRIRGDVVSVPNPVPSQYFVETNPGESSLNVLFAGMMVPRKNVRGLVRAFRRVCGVVPAARLVVAGPPYDRAYLSVVRREIESLQVEGSIDFLGHIDDGALVKAIHQCSVLALFSDEETSPTVIAQAMAAGRPVVASRVGGVPEMVMDGETGYLVDAGDEQALAARLTELLRSPRLCRAMGACGREIARQRYQASDVAGRTVEAYRLALES